MRRADRKITDQKEIVLSKVKKLKLEIEIKVKLKEMVLDYLRHFKLHLDEISELINRH